MNLNLALFSNLQRPLFRAVGAAVVLTVPAFAQTTFQWQTFDSGFASGSWATGTWNPAGPASGSGNTADFSQLDVSVASAVTLDGNVTIGNLIFGDTNTSTAASWSLEQGAEGILTLAIGSGAPTITVNALGTGATTTISAPIAGTGGLLKNGVGNLILTGANTYTGTTKIQAGTLTATSASLNNTAVDFAGGTLRVNGNTATFSNAISVSADSTLTFGTGSNNITNALSSSSSAVKLAISQGNGGSNTVTFGTATSFTGYTGTVELVNKFFRFESSYNGAQAGASTLWQIDAGSQLSYRAGSNATLVFQLGGLQGGGTLSGGGSAGSGTVVYQVGARNTATTFSGVIVDGSTKTGLTKTGGAKLTLSGTNTYTGATTVNAGTLEVIGGIAASATTINGATAVLSGTGTAGAITLTLGSLAPGVDGIGTLNATSLTWNPAATLRFDLGATGALADRLTLAGGFNPTGAGTFTFNFTGGTAGETYTLVSFGAGLTSFTVNDFAATGVDGVFSLDAINGQLNFTAVPEPDGVALVAFALAIGILFRRFRSATEKKRS